MKQGFQNCMQKSHVPVHFVTRDHFPGEEVEWWQWSIFPQRMVTLSILMVHWRSL